MSTMQEFYTWLFQTPETDELGWIALTRLRQSNLAELAALEGGMDWGSWGTETVWDDREEFVTCV